MRGRSEVAPMKLKVNTLRMLRVKNTAFYIYQVRCAQGKARGEQEEKGREGKTREREERESVHGKWRN